MYELVIVGGGPGAVAAGVYAGRKQIKALLITETFGGQSIVSNEIYNWVGTKAISGIDLAKNLEEHVRAHGIEIVDGDTVVGVTKIKDGPPEGHFEVTTKGGKKFETKTILVASGSRHRRLNAPGEDRLDGHGVVFCSTCDAPLFKNKEVAVIGAGNSGLEAIVDLFAYASKITLLVRGTDLRGDPVTQAKVKANPKVSIIYNASTTEVLGEKMVSGLKYQDIVTNEIKTLPVQGVFVEIGSVPNSDFVKDLAELNKGGEIVVDHKTQSSTCYGIWAAGDVSDVIYKQNNISAGDAVKGLLNIYEFLNRHRLTGENK